jgi:hypothetical protein
MGMTGLTDTEIKRAKAAEKAYSMGDWWRTLPLGQADRREALALVSVIDRGRIVTVLNQDEAAVLFGLEMAIQKYGSRIACTGTVEWKRMVTKTAAQHRISVQFTDPEMQHALCLQQRLTTPRQRQQERGGR